MAFRKLLALVLGSTPLALTGCWDQPKADRATPPPAAGSTAATGSSATAATGSSALASAPFVKTEAEWRAMLTDEQYRVTREKDTERPFTGVYWDCHKKGTYLCVCCGERLFTSDAKFESGTGWPSFWKADSKEAVATDNDDSFGMVRSEITCRRCGAHLGHVFDDGPAPTGLRYCVNSASLKLVEDK